MSVGFFLIFFKKNESVSFSCSPTEGCTTKLGFDFLFGEVILAYWAQKKPRRYHLGFFIKNKILLLNCYSLVFNKDLTLFFDLLSGQSFFKTSFYFGHQYTYNNSSKP